VIFHSPYYFVGGEPWQLKLLPLSIIEEEEPSYGKSMLPLKYSNALKLK
jgi:hypothetical protein